jgi:hypothetical protein
MGLNRYRYSGFYNYRSSILSYCVSCGLASRRQPIDTDVQKFKTPSDNNHNHNKQQ